MSWIEILTDSGQKVAKEYGIVFTLTPEAVKIYKEVVDRSAFWEHHARAKPWLHPVEGDAPATVKPADVLALDEAEACIHCAACFSACPVAGPGFTFAGPHAAVQARVRAGDPRDRRHTEASGDDRLGLDHCHGVYACVDACPQGLDPAAAVFSLRRGPRGGK